MAFSSSKAAKRETTLGPNWLELPLEITEKILHKIDDPLKNVPAKILQKLDPLETFTNVSLVCPLWPKICMDSLMWCTIDMTIVLEIAQCPCCGEGSEFPDSAHYKFQQFCLHAIERSCGHLEDISIEDFGTDEILKHIGDRGSHLRRMRLLHCWKISDEQMSEVVKKLPLLEEFEISFSHLSKDTLELMGKCCPNLQVLKFNMQEIIGYESNDEAFAIAKTMPWLRHLQLLGNRLTNEGLLAILDGCPHLESLDLRVCSNVKLSGSLKERCLKQIRDLRFPEDLSDEVFMYVGSDNLDWGNNVDWGNDWPYDLPDEILDLL